MKKKSYLESIEGSGLLLITSLVWGLGFIAQKLGMDHMQPFMFTGVRNYMGALALLPIIYFTGKRAKKFGKPNGDLKTTVIAGIVCGVCLFIASNLQQIGIQYTTAGKTGFITAMYIVLVPIIGFFLGKRIRAIIVFSLVVAVVGLYFLCITDGFYLSKGDTFVLLCALCFSIHIIAVDHFVGRSNPVALSCIQFAVSGTLSTILSLFTETTTMEDIYLCMPALLYAGVVSSGVGYTLQIVGQQKVPPAIASLIMSFESVFSVIFGAVILKDIMTTREIIGCILVFSAVILSQLPEDMFSKKRTEDGKNSE